MQQESLLVQFMILIRVVILMPLNLITKKCTTLSMFPAKFCSRILLLYTCWKELALTLKKSIRGSDVAVRWGGEEFIIITPKTTLEQAQQLAETIRQIVKSTPYSGVGQITASIGVASFEENDSLKSLVQRADVALYRAKKLGRNNVQIECVTSRKQFDLGL